MGITWNILLHQQTPEYNSAIIHCYVVGRTIQVGLISVGTALHSVCVNVGHRHLNIIYHYSLLCCVDGAIWDGLGLALHENIEYCATGI